MRYFRSIMWVCALFLAAPGLSQAAEAVPADLSLADAVRLALTTNVNLKGAEESHRASLSRLRIAGFSTTYSIGSSMGLEDTPYNSGFSSRIFSGLSFKSLGGMVASVDVLPFSSGNDSGSVAASLEYPLMKRRGVLSEKADVVLEARSQAGIQSRELYRSRQSTVLGVIEAYYNAIVERELVNVKECAVALAEQAVDYARKREEAGLGRGIDVSRAEIQVAQTEDRLNVQRRSARTALDRLMIAIGAGVGETPELTDPLPDTRLEVPDLEQAIDTALTHRSELAVFDERAANEERKLAILNDELRPGLNVVARYDSASSYNGLAFGSLFDRGYLTMGLEYRFPLDKRISLEERDTAARGLDVLHGLRDFKKEEIAEEVRRAYHILESAQTSLQIFTQNMDVAKDNLRIAQRMVEEGEGDNRDVLTAQVALTELESGILRAKVDLYLASVNAAYAMGEELTRLASR